MHQLDIRVNGYPLAMACHYGDVEMSTVWPGGSDELSWSSLDMPAALAVGGSRVEAYFGPQRIWSGTMVEPDPSQDRNVATGLWRLAETWTALTSAGAATKVPNTAVDQAINPGLAGRQGIGWQRVASLQSTAVDIDLTQGPVYLSALLDAMATGKGTRWGVDPNGYVYDKVDDTTPTYRTLPFEGGFGLALDNYASTLVGRYFDSGSSTYQTIIVPDPNPVSNVYAEQIVDLTPRGPITSTKATTLLTNLFALGLYRPQFTETLEFSYGELLTAGGTAVDLELVAAGPVVRVFGGTDLARATSGLMYVDVPMGTTTLSDGSLKVQAQQQAARNFTDVLTVALSK